jgi:hypothetical protein
VIGIIPSGERHYDGYQKIDHPSGKGAPGKRAFGEALKRSLHFRFKRGPCSEFARNVITGQAIIVAVLGPEGAPANLPHSVPAPPGDHRSHRDILEHASALAIASGPGRDH